MRIAIHIPCSLYIIWQTTVICPNLEKNPHHCYCDLIIFFNFFQSSNSFIFLLFFWQRRGSMWVPSILLALLHPCWTIVKTTGGVLGLLPYCKHSRGILIGCRETGCCTRWTVGLIQHVISYVLIFRVMDLIRFGSLVLFSCLYFYYGDIFKLQGGKL